MIYIDYKGFLNILFMQYRDTNQTLAIFLFCLGMLICVAVPYLLGSFNTAIIASKYLYHDDIRKYGSGNAGLTNMHRVYGKKGALYTLAGDMLKQILSVSIGLLTMGLDGAFIAGIFCMLGHIAPVYYHFKGGKGVLTAATMVLIIDPVLFLIMLAFFAFIVLIFKYVSLGSVMAAFIYPALVFYRDKLDGHIPSPWYLIFAAFIFLVILFMHRENLKRIYNNEESRFSFKKKPLKEDEVEEEVNNKKKKKK